MTNYIRGPNPIWFMNNLTGETLDDTYYAFFLTNDLPYVPQAVYQDPLGAIPWSDPIEFQPSGGLPNNLYFNDGEVYRIEIRQGPTQSDPLIWLIENYVPSDMQTATVISSILTAQNLITNPQFQDIFFSSPYTFTQAISGTYTLDIAPGWQLVLVGAGTTILTQGFNDGSSHRPGNPATYLQISNSGWTTANLIQKFSNNGAIFSGGAAAILFDAVATSSTQPLTVSYQPSDGTPTTLFSGNIPVGSFIAYSTGSVNIPASTNTDTDGSAYVNINFTLPATGIISLSNIQFTGQSTSLSSSVMPVYQELTYERMVDQEFHVYRNAMLREPKDTILVGWDFGLNPWQFFDPANVTAAATNIYTADQTILVQQAYVASATGSNVTPSRASSANNYGYQLTAETANNQFAIIQYIDPASLKPYWGRTLSSMVRMFLNTTHSSVVTFKMRLIYRAGLPATISQTNPIAAWVAGSDPSFASGWTALKADNGNNDPVYTLTSAAANYAFDGFVLPASTDDNMTLGIVLYTTANMNQNATADSIVIEDVSLVQNDFALESNPKTFDQVLRECQYYYEKSYNVEDQPGTITNENANSYVVAVDNTDHFYNGESLLKVSKRVSPSITFYSTVTGSSGKIAHIGTGDISTNGNETTGKNSTGYPTIANGDSLNIPQKVQWQWVAEARMGL